MSDSILGIAIDSDVLRAVEVSGSRGKKPRVVHAAEQRLPLGVVEGGRVHNVAAVSEALREVLAQNGFHSGKVVVCLDGRQALVRRSSQPVGTAARMRTATGFDIEELLAFPLSEAVFDFAEVSRHEVSGVEFVSTLVVAVHDEVRDRMLDVVSGAGLNAHGIVIGAEALSRAVGAVAGDGLTVLVDAGDCETEIAIRDSGGLLFCRTLPAGVGATATAIADELESQLEGLEGHRSRSSDADSDAGHGAAMRAGASTVVEGVRSTLDYFRTDLDSRDVQRVVLIGSGAATEGLATQLEQAVGVEVTCPAPPQCWEGLEEATSRSWAGYERALGAALTQMSPVKGERTFVLVPPEEARRVADKRSTLVGLAFAVALAAILLVQAQGASADASALLTEAERAEQMHDGLIRESVSFRELADQREVLTGLALDIDSVLADEIAIDAVLREIAELMPRNSRLSSVQVRRAVDDEEVTGYAGSSPVAILQLSGNAEDLAGVGIFVSAVSEATLSTGHWLTQSSYGELGLSEAAGASFTVGAVLTEDALVQRTFLNAEDDK